MHKLTEAPLEGVVVFGVCVGGCALGVTVKRRV